MLRKLIRCAAVLFVALVSSGCAALLVGGAAGAGGYAYARGAKSRTYNQPVTVVADAIPAALEELHLTPTVVKADSTGALIRTVSATDKKIRIDVRPAGKTSEVRVRVGTFGNESITDVILAKLDQRLRELPSEQGLQTEAAKPRSGSPPLGN